MAKPALNDLVLLVDDQPRMRDTLGFLLEAEGFPTALAADGVEGMEGAFIVCITGVGDADPRLDSLDAGADTYLAKAVDHGRLLELVGRRLETWRRTGPPRL